MPIPSHAMLMGAGAASTGRAPDEIGSLLAWYDASDSGSISATGGLVDQWSDLSGNGYHMTQTGAARPTTGSDTMNGLNVLTFGGSHYLINTTLISNDAFGYNNRSARTYIAAVYLTAGGLVFGCGRSATSATPYFCPLWPQTTNLLFGFRGDSGAPSLKTIDSGLSAADSTARLLFARDNNTTPRANGMRVDRSSTVSNTWTEDTNAANVTLTNTTIGGLWRNGSLSNAVTGKIAEIAMFDAYLTTSDILPLETYFAAKWGTG